VESWARVEEASDRDLMARMAQGDQASLSELMRRHHQRLYRIALSYLRDPEDALEVVQETFVKAHRHCARWDGAAEVTPWLTRIAVNEAIDRYRRARRRKAAEEPLSEEGAHDGRWTADGPSPERTVLARELGERITLALLALPEKQRAIFVLRHHHGMELHEIAATLDMRLGTVKSSLHRALERLRDLLAGVAR
jgi:RNA polymerase sigma-70 factor (ECF subfamily)